MLWLDAVYARESKPRLLQGDGFGGKLEYGSHGARFTSCAGYRACSTP